MTRLARIVKGLGALVLLAVLVGAIPWALWHFVGWPLPHHVPSASQIGRSLNRQGIPAQTLVDALAVVVWLTWAILVVSLAVEVPAALSGRHAPHLPVAGVFQPLTGRLVAAVIVACLTLAPRPGHTAPAGASAGPLVGRRPVATLVLTDATLTARTDPVTAAAARPAATQPPAPTAPQPAATPDTYVVQRGDTLWGIAQRELGDPLRWSEIYQLNEGRPQPGGVTLTDPHWIDPGWTLVLPATAAPSAPAQPATAPTPPPRAHRTRSDRPRALQRRRRRRRRPPAAPTHPASTAPHHLHPQTEHAAEPVRLPSGSVVAGSFAAGVVATVAIGRLRRRHAYRYRPPRPGRDLTPPPIRPTLDRLTHASQNGTVEPGVTSADDAPVLPFNDDERRLQPGRLEIGTRDGQPVTVELTDLSGTALSGPTADPVARALLAAVLVRAGPRAAEVVLTEDLAGRLLPGLASDGDIRMVASSDDAARVVEAERIARTRRLAAVEASDADRFREREPREPTTRLARPSRRPARRVARTVVGAPRRCRTPRDRRALPCRQPRSHRTPRPRR